MIDVPLNSIVEIVLVDEATTKNEAVPQARIIGGHEAKPNSHPYLVSLQLRFLWLRGHICGGSIIKENWVLTAAHCIQESWLTRWLPLEAVAGTNDVYDFGSLAQVNSVDQRIPHPKYQGEVQPIQLPLNSNIDGESLQLAGWGALRTTSFLPDLPNRLQEVEVKYISYDECFKAVAELLENDELNPLDRNAHICTGPLSGGIAACSGDSGGPLSSIPVIRGIVSWGISPCGIDGGPTVFTNVFEYMDFVKQYSETVYSSVNK
ncbi:trypsin-2-like [Pieris brassicae]|uniref:trypsin-2-like n=1 Tax=Pieris brassicae TaxID=7116 RepID=UPI001E660607|nr:trypsin-2-like [Pieris brassicae]